MKDKNVKSEQLPLVSVHIITYNQAHFIHDTLQSVLEQGYDNIEIVVADDGSSDGTDKIILDYASRYPGKIIPLVGGPNLGITANANRALMSCKGKYIAFMGGDDLMLPDKIQNQIEYMEKNSICTICYHNLDVFQHESGKSLFLFNDVNKPYSGRVSGLIKYGCVNGACSTVVRRKYLPEYGLDSALPVASDWLLWVEILLKSNGEIHYINKVLGRYRRHGNNVTGSSVGSYNQAIRDYLASCMKLLYLYPEYSSEVRYNLGTQLRGIRFTRDYLPCLISSLKCSFQIKTLILVVIYIMSFCRIKR